RRNRRWWRADAKIRRHRSCGGRVQRHQHARLEEAQMPRINNIVLVHGGFVDGAGWRGVYDILKKDGFNVSIVQNPTISLAGRAGRHPAAMLMACLRERVALFRQALSAE